MASKVRIEIELDESGAIRGFKTLEDKAGKSGRRAGVKFEKGLSSGFKGVGKQLAKIGSLFGSILTGATLAKSISAANAQADAVERLNKSLQASNDFSQQASEDLQNYAAELQKVTEFGDELIINNLALAKSFGATNEQAKKIAETATGLSKEFGISLESATRLAAKTLGGYAGELSEISPEIKNLTQEQLRAGGAIDFLNQRFGDSAKNLPTFSFATKQLSNTFGDLLEEVGKLATESPEVRAAIVALTGVFDKAIGKVKAFASEFSFINDLLIPLSRFGDQIITFVISPLELLGNVFSLAQNSLNTFVAAFVAGFGKIAGYAADFISLFSPDSGTVSALRTFQETSKEVFDEVSADATASLDQIFDFPFSEKLSQKNEELRSGLAEQAKIIAEQAANVKSSLGGTANAVVETTQKMNNKLNGLINGDLVKLIGVGFERFGRQLIEGKKAWEAWEKAVAGIIGDLLINLGKALILKGLAIKALAAALATLSGGLAVAAGAGLIALGGALKAGAGIGKDEVTSGASSGGITDAGPDTDPVAAAEPLQQQQTQNQIIVQGDVFDSEETGLRIFDIISTQSEKNGNVIVGGAFA